MENKKNVEIENNDLEHVNGGSSFKIPDENMDPKEFHFYSSEPEEMMLNGEKFPGIGNNDSSVFPNASRLDSDWLSK